MISQEAIAVYQLAKKSFDEATTEAQAILKDCGWEWVAKDIGEYNPDSRYQYWLVSPEMYGSLELDTFDGGETPEMLEEPDPKWVENLDYILF
jgi:hypothetical protein